MKNNIIPLILILIATCNLQSELPKEQQSAALQKIKNIDLETEKTKLENSKQIFDILTTKANLKIDNNAKYQMYHKTQLFINYNDKQIMDKIRAAFNILKNDKPQEQQPLPQRPRAQTKSKGTQTKEAFLNNLKNAKEKLKDSLNSQNKSEKYQILRDEFKKEADPGETIVDLLGDLKNLKEKGKYTQTAVKNLVEKLSEQIGAYYLGQAIFLPGAQAKQQGSNAVQRFQNWFTANAQKQIIKELKPGGLWDHGKTSQEFQDKPKTKLNLTLLVKTGDLNDLNVFVKIRNLIQTKS